MTAYYLRHPAKATETHSDTASQKRKSCPAVNTGMNSASVPSCCRAARNGYFTDERLCDIVSSIRTRFPDCAITLSVGERSAESYRGSTKPALTGICSPRDLRHLPLRQAASAAALRLTPAGNVCGTLKEPVIRWVPDSWWALRTQTPENLADDMLFLTELNPQMVGIGPFVPTMTHRLPMRRRNRRADCLHARSDRPPAARVLLPAHYSARTIDPGGQGKGRTCRGKCSHAESLPRTGQGKNIFCTTIRSVPGTRQPKA